MMESLLTLKHPLNELLRRIRGKVCGYTDFTIRPSDSLAKEISEEAWTAVGALYKFPRPIKEATDMLSASTYPVFGILLYTYCLIQFHATETIANEQDEQTLKFAEAVKAKMDEYTVKVNTREARIALALAPRAKRHLHLLVDDVAQVKDEVEDEFNKNYREAFLAQQQSASGDRQLEISIREMQREDSSFAKELDRWLAADEGMSEMRERCSPLHSSKVFNTGNDGRIGPNQAAMAHTSWISCTASSIPAENVIDVMLLIMQAPR
ncbi:hypothetical protein PHYSODRAFT_343355 [Phytophthora sojae]|uniref:Uncharacterized protein n=1 Tax=Phytophthora sojae (strain P6497) TaxID=1094619 RepID=G5AJF2_PHYSP|nr:hypothetical protein PHYSODRAFT_343355 [Phytophthora sojae]EGZ04347.1 hypothetical protein PHYSODRAFT_343355 [Phytophthora sojae]|eukprot:XP_009540203.1 hypothetical protein PHYSODRAFT_343355 [Phytophthora sojae]